MFLPHVWVDGPEGKGRLEVVKDGLGIGRYYALRQEKEATLQDLNTDSYDRFFALARLQYAAGSFPEETQAQIIESTMTKDGRMQQLIRKYFGPADYFSLRDRMIGSGAIGGKACGMLLARKIAEEELAEGKHRYEPHDSFYIGSDVFYTYIVANDLWGLRIAQRTKEGYFSRAGSSGKGCFPAPSPPISGNSLSPCRSIAAGTAPLLRSWAFPQLLYGLSGSVCQNLSPGGRA